MLLPKRVRFGRTGPSAKETRLHRFKDTAKAAAIRIRSSQRWKDCRLVKMRENPLCENPVGLHDDGVLVLAQQVHHKIELCKAPHLAFTLENLQSVCTACHAVLSAMERDDG